MAAVTLFAYAPPVMTAPPRPTATRPPQAATGARPADDQPAALLEVRFEAPLVDDHPRSPDVAEVSRGKSGDSGVTARPPAVPFGDLTQAVASATPRLGHAIRLHGGHLKLPAVTAAPLNAFTIELWVRLERSPAGIAALYAADGWSTGRVHFNVKSNGAVELAIHGLDRYPNTAPETLPLNQWVHLAATYDRTASRLRLYRNGRAILDEAVHGAVLVQFPAAAIGAWVNDGKPGRLLHASVDEFRILPVALSAAAVRRRYLLARGVPLEPIDYARRIRPILERHCYRCHGPSEQESELKALRAASQALLESVHERDVTIATLQSSTAGMQEQQARLENQLQQIEVTRQEAEHHSRRLRDELGAVNTDNRGLTVELEQARALLGEKAAELAAVKSSLDSLAERYSVLQNEHTQLVTEQRERDDRHAEQITLLNEARDSLKKEFENLANRIFEDKGKSFTATSKHSLETLLQPFREQISGFQSRINEVHMESVKGHTALESEIRKVLDIGLEMNTQASNLSTALKGDKKTTGNWGEAQLQRTLELAGLEAGEHYEAQTSFRDGGGKRRLPDFLIKLPDGKNLVIDSKVSLVDYDRAIAAQSDEERTTALDAHARAVRHHIDDLSAKDYSNLPDIGSPDFVLMFMPIEPAYIEAMKHNKDLFNYGYQKGVIMVSHTTLMPILRTVANLWMIERSNREAREISGKAGEIYNQVCVVAERLNRLGNTLRAATNQYNDTVTGLAGKQGLHGKVERFAQLSSKANKTMAPLEPIYSDIDSQRLKALSDHATGSDAAPRPNRSGKKTPEEPAQ